MLSISVAVRVTKHHTYHTDEIPGCLHVQSNNRQQIQTQSDSTGLVSQHALCCILLQHHMAHCLGMTVMQRMILCWFRHWLCARKHRFMQMVSCCCCCCLPQGSELEQRERCDAAYQTVLHFRFAFGLHLHLHSCAQRRKA